MTLSPEIEEVVRRALAEDVGAGDVTTELCVDAAARATGTFHARQPMVVAGVELLPLLFDAPVILAASGSRLSEGDRIVTRWTGRGTNSGSLMGMPPSGRSIAVTGISIERIANGKMVETWVNFDALGMMQQLGVVPIPGQG